ncbi:DNA helicase [Colletotrichum tofieldiae]|nr:DNA helicase [Colletotrichum tofieldiae]GKT78845.1 DNA helicase [Colletotrichum tofieldiae]GKT86942.1 DNA helicase [Colletotrichum tofieldiae]
MSHSIPDQEGNATPEDASASVTATPSVKYRNYVRNCALLLNDAMGPVIASSISPMKIGTQLVLINAQPCEPYMGFVLAFTIGGDSQAANESAGFGVRYEGIFQSSHEL